MTQTMRAAVCNGLNQPLQLRELPIPEPAPGQVLVRIAASGVCHTDISIIDGEWMMKRPKFPLIPGHEACGYVAALGGGVNTHREGDRVGVFWLNSACGACELCATSREALCLAQQGTGYDRNGTYADYCLVSADYAVPLPQGPLELLAPIMCAGVTSYRALKELNAPLGSWVVISGLGGTGHLALQYARTLGLHVVAIDVDDDKLAYAQKIGADLVFNAEREFPVNQIQRRIGGAHGVIATAPSAKALEQSVRMLRRGGTCILVGVAREPLPLNVFDMVIKGLSVRGSLIGSRADIRDALELTSTAAVKPLIDSQPLEHVNDAIDAIRKRQVQGRVVLRMV